MKKRKIDRSIRDLKNIDIDQGDTKGEFKGWLPRSREELLAWDLAVALEDRKGLRFYLSCASKYSEGFLRNVLGRVIEIPDLRIKKSRGALFNYMVRRPSKIT